MRPRESGSVPPGARGFAEEIGVSSAADARSAEKEYREQDSSTCAPRTSRPQLYSLVRHADQPSTSWSVAGGISQYPAHGHFSIASL